MVEAGSSDGIEKEQKIAGLAVLEKKCTTQNRTVQNKLCKVWAGLESEE